MVARMRQLGLVVVVLCSTIAFAQSRDGGTCSPQGRFTVAFDHVELIKVSQVLADLTCKPVIVAPGVEKVMISVVTPERQSYTADEFLNIVTQAAELSGASITENKGVIRVTLKKEK